MTNRRLSLASDLFKVMVDQFPIGRVITSGEMRVAAEMAGLQPSEGAVQGFLNRALKKKVVVHDGIYHTKKNQKGYYFRIISHEPWNFKSPGIGSIAGRSLNYTKPLFEGEEMPVNHIPENKKEEPAKREVRFITDQPVADWANRCAADGTATDEIMLRLGEVMALVEAQRGLMTKLSEFTDDEIADEVKRRFHSK